MPQGACPSGVGFSLDPSPLHLPPLHPCPGLLLPLLCGTIAPSCWALETARAGQFLCHLPLLGLRQTHIQLGHPCAPRALKKNVALQKLGILNNDVGECFGDQVREQIKRSDVNRIVV